MDRNSGFRAFDCWQSVALRKESVDRNTALPSVRSYNCTSLSARRAWIEIMMLMQRAIIWAVALRKESVDRNLSVSKIQSRLSVALRKESVDRNKAIGIIPPSICSRSPQGERG